MEFRMQYEDKDPVNLVAPNVINDGREHSVTIQKYPNYAQIKVKLKVNEEICKFDSSKVSKLCMD